MWGANTIRYGFADDPVHGGRARVLARRVQRHDRPVDYRYLVEAGGPYRYGARPHPSPLRDRSDLIHAIFDFDVNTSIENGPPFRGSPPEQDFRRPPNPLNLCFEGDSGRAGLLRM